MKFKPIRDQVMVITDASSGIGLVTARHAAKKVALFLGAGLGLTLLTDRKGI